MNKSIALISVLAAALASPAQAQEQSVTVSYGDLDLTSDTGVARFDNRIDAAVGQVCGDRIGPMPLSTARAVRKCSRDTMADVANPREIAIERARGRQPSVELASAAPAQFAVAGRRR